jgi:hypothetical protein
MNRTILNNRILNHRSFNRRTSDRRTLNHSVLRRFALALLSCLAFPVAAHALTCPPGQIEVNGRCIPLQPHSYHRKFAPPADTSVRPETEVIRPETKAVQPSIDSKAIRPEYEIRRASPSSPSLAPAPSAPPASPSAADIERAEREAVPTGAGNPRAAPSERLLVPVRAYLKSSEIPPSGIGAYGIVAFRAKPTSASRSRLLMTCAAFVASIPTQKSVPGSVRVSDEMLTIWPLDEPASPSAARDDCNFAIDHYDLYGGDSAIADAERQGAKFGEDGPFLIGWSPANSRGAPDKLVLVVDMSRYDSQDSFNQAFQFWKKKIVEDPALWRGGFSIEALRLAVRDFADHYGDTILTAAISVWKN